MCEHCFNVIGGIQHTIFLKLFINQFCGDPSWETMNILFVTFYIFGPSVVTISLCCVTDARFLSAVVC